MMRQSQAAAATAPPMAVPVALEEEREWPPQQGEWTYDDWRRLPDDGWQYEVIKGVLYKNPAPTTIHQRISGNLGFALRAFVRQEQVGTVFGAPTDVYLPGQETPVQPDLLFIAAEREDIISERGIEAAPDIVVEILSLRNWWQDRRVKMPLYEETGVKEFWIVDPDKQDIEVYVLRERRYALLNRWGPGEVARSDVLSGFDVAVDMVMEG